MRNGTFNVIVVTVMVPVLICMQQQSGEIECKIVHFLLVFHNLSLGCFCIMEWDSL